MVRQRFIIMYQQEKEEEREKEVLAVDIKLDVFSLFRKKEKKLRKSNI